MENLTQNAMPFSLLGVQSLGRTYLRKHQITFDIACQIFELSHLQKGQQVGLNLTYRSRQQRIVCTITTLQIVAKKNPYLNDPKNPTIENVKSKIVIYGTCGLHRIGYIKCDNCTLCRVSECHPRVT